MKQQLLLVSSSRCYPHGYLDHCEAQTQALFSATSKVLFVPYARPSGRTHEEYAGLARKRFEKMGLSLRSLHTFSDPRAAVNAAEGVFVGGGNTFVLLRDLYQLDLIDPLREKIEAGMPYMGASAGSNIAGISIGTSNDMPIVHPPSFCALGVVPFNLNPHYPQTPPDPTHHGETREDRIGEFHHFNPQPVVALREDGMLCVDGTSIVLVGECTALIFRKGKEVEVIQPGPLKEL